MANIYDTVIIGAGAAGLTAGIYACRSNMHTVLVEKFIPGGQAALTAFVENYPGFPEGISGYELMDRLRKQALEFDLEIITTEVRSIRKNGGFFHLITKDSELQTRTIIISTGVFPRMLDVPGEKELFGKGISTCATCDGPFYRDMEVAVIGGGDSALEEGLYLTKFASRVHLIHRRDRFRALPTFVEKMRKCDKMVLHLDTVVTRVNGQQSVESLSLKNVKSGEESELPVSGVFLYVGLVPNTNMFKDLLELNDQGFIVVDRNLQTSVPGIFAAGDVRETPLRQIVTAAADGAVAAFSAGRYLEKHE